MNSLILRTATRLLVSLMLLFSLFVLLRGHNDPGGGFIGGLIAASALAVHGLAFGPRAIHLALRIDARAVAGLGLVAALVASLLAAFTDRPFLTALWWFPDLGLDAKLAIGTPLLFDIGVYLVVVGAVCAMIAGFEDE